MTDDLARELIAAMDALREELARQRQPPVTTAAPSMAPRSSGGVCSCPPLAECHCRIYGCPRQAAYGRTCNALAWPIEHIQVRS